MTKPMSRARATRFNRAWSPVTIVVALTAGTTMVAGLVHLVARMLSA